MRKPVRVSKDFYSNCLFEAIKAKLRNPKDVQFIYIPKKYSNGKTPHFMWKVISTGKLYEFGALKDSPNWFQALFEKGYISETPFERHNLIVQRGVERYISKLEKKMCFKTFCNEHKKEVCWDSNFDGELIDIFEKDTYYLISNRAGEIRLVKSTDTLELPENFEVEFWKIVR